MGIPMPLSSSWPVRDFLAKWSLLYQLPESQLSRTHVKTLQKRLRFKIEFEIQKTARTLYDAQWTAMILIWEPLNLTFV